jgi:hypothetical protein
MAYREKLAAVNFAAMAILYTVYFALVASRPPAPHLIDMLWLFGTIATIHAVLAIAGTVAVRIQSGADGRGPPDERDRAIARRGASAAYFVLLAGMIMVGVVMPFTEAPGKIVNTALLAIVLAELTHQGLILLSYRRGWHG